MVIMIATVYTAFSRTVLEAMTVIITYFRTVGVSDDAEHFIKSTSACATPGVALEVYLRTILPTDCFSLELKTRMVNADVIKRVPHGFVAWNLRS